MSRSTSLDQSNCSIVAVGILDQCRLFIRKCVRTAEIENDSNRVRSSIRLSTALLEFMYDISTLWSNSLSKNDLEALFAWCQNLAAMKSNRKTIHFKEIIDYITLTSSNLDDPAFVKSLFKYFTFVTWNKNSSAALIKYICSHLSILCQATDPDVVCYLLKSVINSALIGLIKGIV